MFRTFLCVAAAVGFCMVAAVNTLRSTFAAETTENETLGSLQLQLGDTELPVVILYKYPDGDYDKFIEKSNPGPKNPDKVTPHPLADFKRSARSTYMDKVQLRKQCEGTLYDSTPCIKDKGLLIRWDDVAAIIDKGYCYGWAYGKINIKILVADQGKEPSYPPGPTSYENAVLCFGKASETILPDVLLRQIDEKSAPTRDLVERLGDLAQAILLAIGRCPEHRDWKLNPKTGNCCDPAKKEEGCP
jgi:hypothetical protein